MEVDLNNPERVCNVCGKSPPEVSFEDNWMHKVNKCKMCQKTYKAEYRKLKRKRKEKKDGKKIQEEAGGD